MHVSLRHYSIVTVPISHLMVCICTGMAHFTTARYHMILPWQSITTHRRRITMPNNITPLAEELESRAAENAELAAENFAAAELTEAEKEKVAEMEAETQMVVASTDVNGHRVETPIEEYAEGVDHTFTIPAPGGNGEIKAVNTGDIVQTAEDLKAEARARAIKIYRDLAVDEDENISDDDIMAINASALAAVKEYLGEDKLDSDKTVRKLSRLSLAKLVEILPDKFIRVYATPNEIKANNFKAKERLLSTIAYLTVTGPEMDYLNEYIDREHRLMEVSRKIMSLQVELSTAIQSEEKFSEILKRAAEIEPDDTSVWAKYIKMPNRVHNEFAQRAAVCEEYRKAYETLLGEYKMPDPIDRETATEKEISDYDNEVETIKKCQAMVQEQIDECAAKFQAYTDVTEITMLRELWDMMVARFTADRKNSYKNLTREAVNAVDRIRRAKQNVPFPVYDKRYINRPELLYNLYLTSLPKTFAGYNKALLEISEKDEAADLIAIPPIHVDGYDDAVVWEYFAMLLVILFGRVMKRLGNKGLSKYDAIMLDCYFKCYCTMATDIYMMTDIWNMCKDFVVYCIDHYPKPKK
ncbi:MAG: hypothetical protein NC311_06730 [Muribaculaceae bacterium]|nr:hypothetical protein [Muribaculaceae bacterium]